MKHFFKKNKIFIGIIIAGFIIGGFVYLSKPKDQIQQVLDTSSTSGSVENLSFDLDISNLSYNLPEYTKICLPEIRNDCFSDGDCVRNKPVVFLLYNEESNMMYRCDKNPCDGYETDKVVSGLYANFSPKIPRGFMVKISHDNEYVEVLSLGLELIIYKGKCIDV